MNTDDERLMAYVDGQLDAAARAGIEAELQRNPALAQWVAAQQALRRQLQEVMQQELQRPVPQRLADAVWQAPAGNAALVDLSQRRKPHAAAARRVPWVWSGAVAASLAIGVALGIYLSGGSPTAPLVSGADGLIAGGALREALDRQPSSAGAEVIRIGLSFRDHEAHYCRTFMLASPTAMAGLACHADGQWSVTHVMPAQIADQAGGLRMATTTWPATLMAVVGTQLAGDALDAAGEARAIAEGWRKP